MCVEYEHGIKDYKEYRKALLSILSSDYPPPNERSRSLPVRSSKKMMHVRALNTGLLQVRSDKSAFGLYITELLYCNGWSILILEVVDRAIVFERLSLRRLCIEKAASDSFEVCQRQAGL